MNFDVDKFPYNTIDFYDDTGKVSVTNDASKDILRCEKISIKLSRNQRLIIQKWFAIYRWCYNKTIKFIRHKDQFEDGKNIYSFYTLRKLIKSSFTKNEKQRIKKSKIPVHTLDNAIRDVCKAYKTAFTLLKSEKIKFFRLRTKKATSPKETILLESSCFSKTYNSFAIRALGKLIDSSKSIMGITHDSRLQYCKHTGSMTLYVPVNKATKVCTGRKEWCSLDPGIRTFQTLYSPYGVDEFGTEQPIKIKKLIKKIEGLKENEKDVENKKWYKKFAGKRYKRIQNIRDDLHWKTALKLVKNYDTILLGSMSTKGIVSNKRHLNKGVKTTSYMLGHYLFRQRLEAKAEEYDSKVFIVNEAWTSKTCGGCSKVHHNLGSNKTFKCPQPNNICSFEIDRDVNGARNIALNHFGFFKPVY